jgi:hypothetical protein
MLPTFTTSAQAERNGITPSLLIQKKQKVTQGKMKRDIKKDIKCKIKTETTRERERNKNKEIMKEAVKGFTCHWHSYVSNSLYLSTDRRCIQVTMLQCAK